MSPSFEMGNELRRRSLVERGEIRLDALDPTPLAADAFAAHNDALDRW